MTDQEERVAGDTQIAYKVLTAEQANTMQREGRFDGSPADLADGFIHMSTAAQLAGTIEKHFGGQAGLMIAAVDLTTLGDAVRWESSRGGQLFPHLYGNLPLAAVLACAPVERTRDGALALPG